MNASHVTGATVAGILAAAAVGLLSRYTSFHVSVTDATVVGSAALAGGIAVGHAIGKYGLAGILKLVLHGTPKAAA